MPNAITSPLGDLLDSTQGPCVSVYVPVEARTAKPTQNVTRIENLLRDAAARLAAHDPDVDATALLAPAYDAIARPFWRGGARGLALFAAPGFFRSAVLPYPVDERIVIGADFYVRPLLALVQEPTCFYVLALSLAGARLVVSGSDGTHRVELGEDTGFDALMGYREYDAGLQTHMSGAPGNLGKRGSATVHGHGGADEERLHDDLQHYFRRLGERVEPLLEARVPLVLAAVERHIPLYRAVTRYPTVIEGFIAGNPETLSDDELAERARPLVTAWQRERAVRRAVDLGRRGHLSDRLEDIVNASADGRVDTLLVADGVEEWGTFDVQRREVEIHLRPEPGDEDLVHRAALETLRRGGHVVALPADLLDGLAARAALRY